MEKENKNLGDQKRRTLEILINKVGFFLLAVIGLITVILLIFEYALLFLPSENIKIISLLGFLDSALPSILILFLFFALIPFVPKKSLLIPVGISIWLFEGLKEICNSNIGTVFICLIGKAIATLLFGFFLFSAKKKPIIYLILLPYIIRIIFGVYSHEPELIRKSFVNNEEKITNEALEARNLKKCSEIRPLLFLPQSVSTFLFPNLIVYTPTYPHIYRRPPTAIGYCLTKIAILEKDESKCRIIKNLSNFYYDLKGIGMFDICLNNVAIAKNDISICKLTERKEGTFHDERSCVSKITLLSALSQNDINLCEKTKRRENCYALMAIFTHDETLCDKVKVSCNNLKKNPEYFCEEFLYYDRFINNPSVIQFYNECVEKSREF